jgi:hypothetical protein
MKVSRNPTVHCRAVQAAVWLNLEFEFQFGSRELVSGGRWKGVRHLENQHVCTLIYCSAFLWSFARTLRAWFRNENSQIEGLMSSDQGLRPEEHPPPPAPQLPLAPQPPLERPPAAIAQDHPPPSRVMAGGERGKRTWMGRGAGLWRGWRRAVVGGRRRAGACVPVLAAVAELSRSSERKTS